MCYLMDNISHDTNIVNSYFSLKSTKNVIYSNAEIKYNLHQEKKDESCSVLG